MFVKILGCIIWVIGGIPMFLCVGKDMFPIVLLSFIGGCISCVGAYLVYECKPKVKKNNDDEIEIISQKLGVNYCKKHSIVYINNCALCDIKKEYFETNTDT
jgi:hypothetical protein